MALQFTSILPVSQRRALEQLIFQHPQQGRFRHTILDCIEEFGVPRVVERTGRLRIELDGGTELQALYALMEGGLISELVGAVAYGRVVADEITVLHIAVKDEYTAYGPKAGHQVTFALVEELSGVARRIQGVKGLRLAYSRGRLRLNSLYALEAGDCAPERVLANRSGGQSC